MYIADTANNQVVKFNSSGQVLAVFQTSAPALFSPNGVAVDQAQNVWIADTNNNRIVQLSSNGTQLAVVTASSPSFYYPFDVVVDATGTLYVSDTFNRRLVKVTASRTVTTFYSPLNYPQDLVLDYMGNVFVCDTDSNRIVQISPQGTLLQVFIPSPSSLTPSYGVTLDSQGNLYTTTSGTHLLVTFAGVNPPTPTPQSLSSSSSSSSFSDEENRSSLSGVYIAPVGLCSIDEVCANKAAQVPAGSLTAIQGVVMSSRLSYSRV